LTLNFEVVHTIPGRVRLYIPRLNGNPTLGEAVSYYISAKPGIKRVRVNISCASVTVDYDLSKINGFVSSLARRRFRIGATLARKTTESSSRTKRLSPDNSLIKHVGQLIMPTAAFVLSWTRGLGASTPVAALVAAACFPVFRRAWDTIRKERRFSVDFLDATALAIMGIQRNYPTCAFMAWLISLGEHIREATARCGEKAIADLLRFHSDTVVLLMDGSRVRVPIEHVKTGDQVIVNAGDYVPVDGVVKSGRAAVNQMSLTGESALVDTFPQDRVYAGSIVTDGELVVEACAVGSDTRAGRIIGLLRSAPTSGTKIEDYAARFADRLVLPTFALSGTVYAISHSLPRALSTLIVDFGTGVRVAAPTSFLSSMALAARQGIVFKGGSVMERLSAVDTVVFDKTGTLTTGEPEVRRVKSFTSGFSETDVLLLAASAELGLNHPIAKALDEAVRRRGLVIPMRHEIRFKVGMGVRANIAGMTIAVGSERMMRLEGIDMSSASSLLEMRDIESESPLYVAADGRLLGIITYTDRIRPESVRVINGLREAGIKRIVILTGDRHAVACSTARDLGISDFVSEVFPDKKLDIVKDLQREGRVVAVVGDGLNDSPALAHADVAIAPHGASDAAREAADVLLMKNDLNLLVRALHISRDAMGLVRQNYGIVAVPNASAIAMAALGFLGPRGATLINNGTTVVAGLNSLKPLVRANNPDRARACLGVCDVSAIG